MDSLAKKLDASPGFMGIFGSSTNDENLLLMRTFQDIVRNSSAERYTLSVELYSTLFNLQLALVTIGFNISDTAELKGGNPAELMLLHRGGSQGYSTVSCRSTPQFPFHAIH